MVLNIQILSLVVSFLYGIFFYVLLDINYKFLISSNWFIKILSSLIFVLVNTLLYFIILVYINHGYIHIYFFICMLGGYFLCKVLFKWFESKTKLWYTRFKKSR